MAKAVEVEFLASSKDPAKVGINNRKIGKKDQTKKVIYYF